MISTYSVCWKDTRCRWWQIIRWSCGGRTAFPFPAVDFPTPNSTALATRRGDCIWRKRTTLSRWKRAVDFQATSYVGKDGDFEQTGVVFPRDRTCCDSDVSGGQTTAYWCRLNGVAWPECNGLTLPSSSCAGTATGGCSTPPPLCSLIISIIIIIIEFVHKEHYMILKSLDELREESDETLFRSIRYNPHHVLHHLLPPT